MQTVLTFDEKQIYKKSMGMPIFQLVSMIARKLEYDVLLLGYGDKTHTESLYRAFLGYYNDYQTSELKANGNDITIKHIDYVENIVRCAEDMYGELIGLMYKTLESGGKLSDGKNEIDASDVPDFMIECDLHGYA